MSRRTAFADTRTIRCSSTPTSSQLTNGAQTVALAHRSQDRTHNHGGCGRFSFHGVSLNLGYSPCSRDLIVFVITVATTRYPSES